MAKGEWRKANGEWRMAKGEWRKANGEWRMANDRLCAIPRLSFSELAVDFVDEECDNFIQKFDAMLINFRC